MWGKSVEELRSMIQGILNGIAKGKRFKGISNILKTDNGYEIIIFYKYKT